jgi:small subunit ribosomal protein S20
MANIKSQIKRNRQSERARVRNKSVRSALKTAQKKVRTATDGGDLETAEARGREAARALDQAVSAGVVHKRTAARRKSRLARQIARASIAAADAS